VGGVSVRFAREGEEPALLELLTASFGRWPSVDVDVPPLEHLRWKMSSHPATMGLHVVAEAAGRPVGLWIMGAQPYKVRDRVLLCRRAADSCVHPDYQGRGVITRMREESAPELHRHLDLRLGGQARNEHMLKLVRREPYDVLANRVDILSCDPNAGGATDDANAWSITAVDAFDERSNAFWDAASRTFDFIGVRDRRYLNWRYEARAGDFTRLVAEQDGVLLGYAVLRITRERGNVADLLALPERLDVARSLLREALRGFRHAGLDTARCWLPAVHPYRGLFEEEGFAFEKPRKPPFIVGPLGMEAGGLAFLTDPYAAVHITMGESEVL
jgi:hypothetical protein